MSAQIKEMTGNQLRARYTPALEEPWNPDPRDTLDALLETDRLPATPLVAVLLCTYQGEQFLSEQINSISAQTHPNITVWVSDDDSRDATTDILHQYQALWRENRFSIRQGPKKGPVANFFSLLFDESIEAEYFAFSDQDDIWHPDKLSRALTALAEVPSDVPALYCGRTSLIDADGNPKGLYRLFSKRPSFANALVQNIGGGNTMVMNKAACDALRAMGQREVVIHDWWAYIVISGVGGKVIYDPEPAIEYRLHDDNVIGFDYSLRAQLLRIRNVVDGHFQGHVRIHVEALQPVRDKLTPENRQVLDNFCEARHRWLLPRLWTLWKSGVYRQTLTGNFGLFVAAIFGKI